MPQTDHLALCSDETKKEFTDLFNFAKAKGAIDESSRGYYGQRFAADPHGTRRDLDLQIAGAVFSKSGQSLREAEVHDLAGYPQVSAGSDTDYPQSWVPKASHA